MTHGGPRKGAGRKRGGKNRAKLQLEVEAQSEGRTLTAGQRHALLKREIAMRIYRGQGIDAISAVLRIPEDRLRVLFGHELKFGREIIEGEILMNLAAQAEAGNVAAGKAILAAADGEGAPGKTEEGHTPGSVADRALRLINGGKT